MKCYVDNCYFVEKTTDDVDGKKRDSIAFLTSSNDVIRGRLDNNINISNDIAKFTRFKRIFIDVFAYNSMLYYKILDIVQ